ncbi:MAG: hypothetical protein U0Q21_09690 [Dermatophilaceae bacterium]
MLAIVVGLVPLGGLWLSMRPVVAAGYQTKVTTGGTLEARYLATGPHPVIGRTVGQFQSFSPYRLWFPTDLPSSATLPVVLVANGTGVKAEKYAAWFERLASWGFLVVGTDDEYSWSGLSQAASIRLLQSIQAGTTPQGWEDNPLKGRIDLTRVGLAGHSQGGVGVFSTLADKNVTGVTFKAAYAASPTNLHLAHNLGWDYTAERVTVPTLLLSSTGQGDENLVVSGAQLKEIYDQIPATTPKVMARRTHADHGQMLTAGDGYMTAWFLWHLTGEEQARSAFVPPDGELLHNRLYQDQASTITQP